ncbi:helix-turn-helix domain-containing protein [Anaerocolumna sedimenticola]|uniref:Helix-turn-helix domain-containing protein n=1 Tax=Anaerocolumna sedimenticola TaxID=2696063 RepID=A0A6P1TP42_9FIRM|nr:IclR family transcriptional regulator [Anaerocolumna sedimenticola]QHQ61979.1 helix-turn-helix domain-containing protein [Anaerocolumna sedimenticola]
MTEDKNNHRSTNRVLDVLELIASNQKGYTYTEICEKIDAPKSSMFPILHTLVDRHYLFIDAKSRYKIDRAAFQVGNSYLEHLNFLEEAQNILVNIVNRCAETCHFAILSEGDVLYLKKIDSPESIRMFSSVGKRIPAYGTALGKALLMDYNLNELKKLYPKGLVPLTKNTIADFDQLQEQLIKARMDGYAYEIEESNEFIRCIAVPIHHKGAIVAAISVAVPTFRYTEEKSTLIKMLLSDAQNKLESILKNLDADFKHLI